MINYLVVVSIAMQQLNGSIGFIVSNTDTELFVFDITFFCENPALVCALSVTSIEPNTSAQTSSQSVQTIIRLSQHSVLNGFFGNNQFRIDFSQKPFEWFALKIFYGESWKILIQIPIKLSFNQNRERTQSEQLDCRNAFCALLMKGFPIWKQDSSQSHPSGQRKRQYIWNYPYLWHQWLVRLFSWVPVVQHIN